MKKLELIIEQIKSAYPDATINHDITNKKMRLTLKVLPFGEVIIDENYHISIKYSNPYSVNFNTYKSFFKSRLNVEGYEPYIYEEKIELYKRTLTTQNEFEDAIIRANSFIQVIQSIEKFIEWNVKLNNKK